jgi:hypothetical protein
MRFSSIKATVFRHKAGFDGAYSLENAVEIQPSACMR